jgi:hypothetical protein
MLPISFEQLNLHIEMEVVDEQGPVVKFWHHQQLMPPTLPLLQLLTPSIQVLDDKKSCLFLEALAEPIFLVKQPDNRDRLYWETEGKWWILEKVEILVVSTDEVAFRLSLKYRSTPTTVYENRQITVPCLPEFVRSVRKAIR